MTSTPQLGGEASADHYQTGGQEQNNVTVSEPVVVEEPVAETAWEVPVESGPQGTGPSLTSTPAFGKHLPAPVTHICCLCKAVACTCRIPFSIFACVNEAISCDSACVPMRC